MGVAVASKGESAGPAAASGSGPAVQSAVKSTESKSATGAGTAEEKNNMLEKVKDLIVDKKLSRALKLVGDAVDARKLTGAEAVPAILEGIKQLAFPGEEKVDDLLLAGKVILAFKELGCNMPSKEMESFKPHATEKLADLLMGAAAPSMTISSVKEAAMAFDVTDDLFAELRRRAEAGELEKSNAEKAIKALESYQPEQ
jgi:hypothetical protein